MKAVKTVKNGNSKKAVETSKNVEAPKQADVKKEAEKTTLWAQKMAELVKQQEAEAVVKAEQKAKEQAEKKRPGVIKTILDVITSAPEPITQKSILEKLKIEFPNRDEKSMTNTIKAQIGGKKRPLRMEREKLVVFEITTNKAGVSKYSIAVSPEDATTEVDVVVVVESVKEELKA